MSFIWDKKKYLKKLQKHKIPISSTIFIKDSVNIIKLLQQIQSYKWKKFIIKPIGGTTSFGLGIFETKESIIEKEKFNLEVQKIKNSLDIENAKTESEIDSLKTKNTSTTNTTIHGSVNTSINNGVGSIPLILIVMVIFLGIIGVIFLLSNG